MATASFERGNKPQHQADPASGAFSITPGATELSPHARSLYVGTKGTLVITTIQGDTVTLVNAEGIIPIRCSHVLADTGDSPATATTDADDILGLV